MFFNYWRWLLAMDGFENHCQIIYIENADATPPHLEVTLRLVSSDGVQGSLQVFAFGLFSCFL